MSRLIDTWNEEIKDIDRQISELHEKRRDIQLKADAITIKAWQDSGELPYKVGDVVRYIGKSKRELQLGQKLMIKSFSLSQWESYIITDIKYLWANVLVMDGDHIGYQGTFQLHQIEPIS